MDCSRLNYILKINLDGSRELKRQKMYDLVYEQSLILICCK